MSQATLKCKGILNSSGIAYINPLLADVLYLPCLVNHAAVEAVETREQLGGRDEINIGKAMYTHCTNVVALYVLYPLNVTYIGYIPINTYIHTYICMSGGTRVHPKSPAELPPRFLNTYSTQDTDLYLYPESEQPDHLEKGRQIRQSDGQDP
jgi:hypothetical protein